MRISGLTAPLLLLAIGGLGTAWCLTDPYRGRISLMDTGKLSGPADVDWPPDQAPDWNRFDPPGVLEPLVPLASASAGEGSTLERALNVLEHVATLGGPNAAIRTDVVSIDTDDPVEIMEQVRSGEYQPNCAHYQLILHTFLEAAGMSARMVGLVGSGWLDGQGHAANEVWLPESRSWMLLDPRFHAWFEDEEGRPLSTREVRARLLSDGPLQLRQGEIRADPRPPEELLDFYDRYALRLTYVGVNNILEARRSIYDSGFARAIRLERWPRQLRRVMENAVWSLDRRYLYIDRPEIDEHFVPWYVLRASLASAAVGALWGLVVLVRGRTASRAATDAPVT